MRSLPNMKILAEVTSLTTKQLNPKRGEIWLVNFDPTVGAEIRKTRPAIVISSDAIGKLPIRLIAPITEWKDHFAGNLWHVRMDPDKGNGLDKASAMDVLQVRGVDISRFIKMIGRAPAYMLDDIAAAVAAVVEYS
jgi:mRNA interferase MazF